MDLCTTHEATPGCPDLTKPPLTASHTEQSAASLIRPQSRETLSPTPSVKHQARAPTPTRAYLTTTVDPHPFAEELSEVIQVPVWCVRTACLIGGPPRTLQVHRSTPTSPVGCWPGNSAFNTKHKPCPHQAI